jgi:DnaJ family protein B protein 6
MPTHNPFTDPFVIFNSMLGDFNRHFRDPFMNFDDMFNGPRQHERPRHDRFDRENMFGPGGPGPMPAPGGFGMFGGIGASGSVPRVFRSESTFSASGGHHGWQRESRVTTTVNGVTKSKWTRVDSEASLHSGIHVYILMSRTDHREMSTSQRHIPMEEKCI